ncbi:MAG: CPBP family intramembrane metalloprotease [Chloroflexi bacterium]|nr:CPBP family intramembrane metalloprotease [Chloroflexota bacterium]
MNISNRDNKIGYYSNSKTGIAIIILIMLQFCFLQFILLAVGMDSVDALYWETISSYIIIVSSVILFNSSVLEIFRDQFTLWIIVISCFLPIGYGGERIIYKSILMILGIILAVYILANRKNIKIPSLKSLLIGVGLSFGALFVIALVYALFDQTFTGPLPSNIWNVAFNVFTSQLTFTSVIEEACFRGLIFSFIVAAGSREDKAFIVQALLFWVIHVGYVATKPVLFFVIVPLSTLFLTLIVRKYRMLYLSIMMHTLINVFTTILVAVINSYFF